MGLTENDRKTLEIGGNRGSNGSRITIGEHHDGVSIGGFGGLYLYNTLVFQPALGLLQRRLDVEFHSLHRSTMLNE